MRNKASLSLIEQLVMILVFSLAAALCLGAFARAQFISDTTARRETGARIAQNAAEWLKAGEAVEELPLPEGYHVLLRPQKTDIPGLGLAVVEVWYEAEKEPVFALETGWQEGAP